jgi:hypothetical protein
MDEVLRFRHEAPCKNAACVNAPGIAKLDVEEYRAGQPHRAQEVGNASNALSPSVGAPVRKSGRAANMRAHRSEILLPYGRLCTSQASSTARNREIHYG